MELFPVQITQQLWPAAMPESLEIWLYPLFWVPRLPPPKKRAPINRKGRFSSTFTWWGPKECGSEMVCG